VTRCRLVIYAVTWLTLLACTSVQASTPRQVLVLFDEDNDLPGLAAINRSLREGLRGREPGITFYSESLQLSQFDEEGYDVEMRDYFAHKYANKKLDLIVTVMEPSLDFILRHRDTLFTGVPIVFSGIDSTDFEGRTLPEGVTGVMMKRQFAPTLEVALALQPGLRTVFVVGGTSRFDRRIQDIARLNFQPFEKQIKLEWLTQLSMPQLLEKLASAPPRTAVYYLTLFADGAGTSFTTHDALVQVVRASGAPVYVALDQYVGSGAVGGSVYSVASLGEQAARIAARVLDGEPAGSIAPVALAAYVNTFDWRALQRWHLDEGRLPAGSNEVFRTPSAWESYRGYIVGGITLILFLLALVVVLLLNRAQRRRAEQARRESDEHRRRAEEDAQRQRDELAHALRLTTLGELTASIAHELNQPLTAIAANAQAAQQLLHKDRNNPDVQEALEDLVSDSIRASETISRLQTLFRKKRGAHAPLELNSLIDDVLHVLGSDLRQRQIRVQFVRAAALPKVQGDGVQLRQVFINLLRNAEDAIGLGEGAREIRIESHHPDAGHIVTSVRDSGVGVEDGDLERIFEHFVSSKPQGLGMGLSISRSIVEAHGGRLWATRNEDRGLTLHIQLPVESVSGSPPIYAAPLSS